MTQRSSLSNSKESWTDRAIHYAREHGWLIVPLQANARSSPTYSEDPVEKRLGSFVHVDYPEEATADPDGIRELGTQFPVALIGAVTGSASDLIAVEVKHPQTESTSLRDRLEAVASEAPRILGTNREYILFRHPHTVDSLPRLSEENGIVLHGEESVIRLPWRYYKWSLDEGSLEVPDEALLSLFGVEADDPIPDRETSAVALKGKPNGRTNGKTRESTKGKARRHSGQANASYPVFSKSKNGGGCESDSLFRSGSDLRCSPEESTRLPLPWVGPGGLSLLTAPPKTGASTWTLNLSVHLVAGRSFLEEETTPSDVVMLASSSPSSFRRLLRNVDVLQRDDFSRLHVLHVRDVCDLDWRSTLQRAYRRVESVGADLLVVDCLDRYVRLKGGGLPTEAEEVIHALTAEAPPESAVLAVKSSDCEARESIDQTMKRLGLLGRAADRFLRLDDVSNPSFPSLRRLLATGPTGRFPQALYCALRQGRYERIRRGGDEARSQEHEHPSFPDRFVSAPGFDSLPT